MVGWQHQPPWIGDVNARLVVLAACTVGAIAADVSDDDVRAVPSNTSPIARAACAAGGIATVKESHPPRQGLAMLMVGPKTTLIFREQLMSTPYPRYPRLLMLH